METTFVFFIFTLLGTFSAVACYIIAFRKQLNVLFWAISGFILGPFAIPIAMLAPSQVRANHFNKPAKKKTGIYLNHLNEF